MPVKIVGAAEPEKHVSTKLCPLKPRSAIVGGDTNLCDLDRCAFFVLFDVDGRIGGNCAIPLVSIAIANLEVAHRPRRQPGEMPSSSKEN